MTRAVYTSFGCFPDSAAKVVTGEWARSEQIELVL
jgi:hypothetical protein